ncbi:hypothetical protein O166_03325 [Pseudogulbenkiania ferrooxidans EGD-HP2]|uniref:Uncharacterized protein n=1 Tax=Pseudogulbenkiania ferrooxidans EGD-HP2 TaxID=1388764 RepID=A0ABN0NAP2_9NEIS|nr:hypothetical protein O166_03325 [Pseudogulbenkiania ferrooxidans EGD-HP2]
MSLAAKKYTRSAMLPTIRHQKHHPILTMSAISIGIQKWLFI